MFVDIAKIHVKSGNGGNGKVAFRREKFVPNGGPSGGNGGRGSDVILAVDNRMRTLMDFKYKRKYVAKNGENGGEKKMSGKNADPLILSVPPGTIVKDAKTNMVIADLVDEGDKFVVAKGGRGGRGNAMFVNSVRQAPTFSEHGEFGEEREIILELKMLADVGLIGFPNVGKSTILSTVTKAKPKVANYHFTTLRPNLGVVEAIKGKSFVLADIPGIIEGAHEGIGLGDEFLRHIERTKLLIHVVDVAGSEGRDPLEDFDLINNELKKYNEKLSTRKQVVVANKSDLLFEDDSYEEFKTTLEERGYKVFKTSAATRQGLDELMLKVTELLETIEDTVIFEESEEELMIDTTDEQAPSEIDYAIDEKGVYVVYSEEIQRLLYSTNVDDINSLRRFQNILKKKGVFDTLERMGIDDGDIVRVIDFEFEYIK